MDKLHHPQRFGDGIAVVLQDVFLFHGDVASNIRLGNEAITDERIREACRTVHADTFIEKLDGGYNAEIRERGNNLSVGQKQLLAFARALAADPAILVLDEATSSIDTETEQLIQDANGKVTYFYRTNFVKPTDLQKSLQLLGISAKGGTGRMNSTIGSNQPRNQEFRPMAKPKFLGK